MKEDGGAYYVWFSIYMIALFLMGRAVHHMLSIQFTKGFNSGLMQGLKIDQMLYAVNSSLPSEDTD